MIISLKPKPKNGQQFAIRCVERVMGLEPMLGPWKGHVLPLHHTRLFDPLWSFKSRGDRI